MTSAVPSSPIELHHELQYLARVAAVEIAGRLVGEHDSRPRDERPRDCGALPLSPRELGRPMVEPFAEAYAIEKRHRLPRRIRPRHAPDE